MKEDVIDHRKANRPAELANSVRLPPVQTPRRPGQSGCCPLEGTDGRLAPWFTQFMAPP